MEKKFKKCKYCRSWIEYESDKKTTCFECKLKMRAKWQKKHKKLLSTRRKDLLEV
jgi:hypothetical protein